MVKENVLWKSTRFVFKDIIFDLVYWVYWWYTAGLAKAFWRMVGTISQGNAELGLMVWVKNVFRPMFGQYDWQGRLISFCMRIIQIIIRSVMFLFWVVFALFGFIFWILLPAFLIFQILFNFGFVEKLWP